MKVLITGATGFLGRHLAGMLAEENIATVAIRRESSDVRGMPQGMGWYCNNAEDLDRLFEENTDISHVIHAATAYETANSGYADLAQSNTIFPLTLLDRAVRHRVRVFINCDTCFNNATRNTYQYMMSYQLSKRHFSEWGELATLQHDIRFLNLRLFHPYGPGDGPNKFVASMINRCSSNESTIALTPGQQRKDFIFVADVVSAIACLLRRGDTLLHKYADIDCGTGHAVSIREFVETVHRLCDSTSTLDFGALPYRENEIMYSEASPAILKGLGWSPRVSLEQGIVQTIQAVRTHSTVTET